MKRILVPLLLLLLAGVHSASLAQTETSQIPLADPYILLEDGTYYAYGTNDADGIRCYSSTDLKYWRYRGLALNKANTTETRWFWAPEVYHVGNRYIMYYSANEHLYAATSLKPTGPFRQYGSYQMDALLGDEKCIDSHVFFDDDGTAYLFFVRFTDGNCIWQVQLADDYITPVEGTPKKCLSATESWELKRGKVTEGPNVYKNASRYFLTYSANDYQSQDYAVGYALSTNIAQARWTKMSSYSPFLHRWNGLYGTGHHSLFTDKEGKLRIVFHAHKSESEIHPRAMYIATVKCSSNIMRMDYSDETIVPVLGTPPSAVESPSDETSLTAQSYYTPDGLRHEAPVDGINLVKQGEKVRKEVR